MRAARRVWWRVGRPALRELEEAGIDGAWARRRWNSAIRKAKLQATPEEQKEINEALAKIVQELSPKFHRRI